MSRRPKNIGVDQSLLQSSPFTIQNNEDRVQNQAKHNQVNQQKVAITRAPQPRELAGKYIILAKIAKGGYSTVYKGIDLRKKDKKVFAIKRVTSANIKTLTQNHPCIEVKILEQFRNKPFFPVLREQLCDIRSGSFSLVMDYFEHDCFSDYVRKLTETDTTQYMFVLLHCIHTLAQNGYVHRDIKPSNFLFDLKNKKYLLVDFGLCQLQKSIDEQNNNKLSHF